MKITYIIWEPWCGKSYIAQSYHSRKTNTLYTTQQDFLRYWDLIIQDYNPDTIIIDNVSDSSDVIALAESMWCNYLILISDRNINL